jgi:hypothetical protein
MEFGGGTDKGYFSTYRLLLRLIIEVLGIFSWFLCVYPFFPICSLTVNADESPSCASVVCPLPLLSI